MLGKRRVSRSEQASSRAARSRSNSAVGGANASGPDNVVKILRLSHDGRGVAKTDAGKTLFVERTLPGEKAEITVHRTHRRFDEAHPRRLLDLSDQRVTPVCQHFSQCGGCDLQHLALEGQRRHKQTVLKEQFARQGVESDDALLESIGGDGFGYRRRARLGVKVAAEGQIHFGFRARGSHRLIDIEQCPILALRLEALLVLLREQLETLEAPRLIGHLELLESAGGVCVVLRQLKSHPQDAKRWLAFAQAHKLGFSWWLGRASNTAQPSLQWLTPAPPLHYELTLDDRKLRLEFAPGDFIQVNGPVNQALVTTALNWLAPLAGVRALDLFAGMGNFSLALAAQKASVIGVEGSAAMVERLHENARRNSLTNVEARQANLYQPSQISALFDGQGWDLVVLDPPRDGAALVCRQLAKCRIPLILYISCDPATLARDAAWLQAAGYRLRRTALVDMFPQTAHMESISLFDIGSASDSRAVKISSARTRGDA